LEVPREKLTTLQMTRGIAAMLVMFFHANFFVRACTLNAFDNVFVFGNSGVDFFFVLSGFIITFVHKEHIGARTRVARYFRKRFVRIYPSYWVATIIFAFPLVILRFVGLGQLDWWSVPCLLQNLFLAPTRNYPILPPTWTLQHEILFYLLFASLIFNRTFGVVALVSWLLGIGVSLILNLRLGFPWDFFFSLYNLHFFLGICAALMVNKLTVIAAWMFLGLGITVFLLAGFSESRSVWIMSDLMRDPVPLKLVRGFSSLSIIMGLASLELHVVLRGKEILYRLGSCSYSLYLAHLIVMSWFVGIFIITGLVHRMNGEMLFVALIIVGILGGLLFYRFVEDPLRQKLSTPIGHPAPAVVDSKRRVD